MDEGGAWLKEEDWGDEPEKKTSPSPSVPEAERGRVSEDEPMAGSGMQTPNSCSEVETGAVDGESEGEEEDAPEGAVESAEGAAPAAGQADGGEPARVLTRSKRRPGNFYMLDHGNLAVVSRRVSLRGAWNLEFSGYFVGVEG